MWIYFSVMLIVLLISFYTERRDRVWGVLLIIAAISLISGLRDYSVGTDTLYYHNIFNNFYHGGGIYFRERVFMYISNILMGITGNDRIVFLFYSFLTNILIVSRLWSWRNKGSFTLMLFFYLTLYFPQSMNIMRQYVAVAVLFWASELLFKERYKSFVLAVIVAACFHYSALLAFVMFPIHYLMNNKKTTNKFALIVLIAISSVFVAVPLRTIALEYSGYFMNKELDLGVLTVINIALYITYLMIRYCARMYDQDVSSIFFNDYATVMYGIGLIFTLVGSFFDQMGRLGLIFTFFSVVFMSTTVNRNRYCQLYRAAYISYALIYLVIQVTMKGEQGIMPYSLYF